MSSDYIAIQHKRIKFYRKKKALLERLIKALRLELLPFGNISTKTTKQSIKINHKYILDVQGLKKTHPEIFQLLIRNKLLIYTEIKILQVD